MKLISRAARRGDLAAKPDDEHPYAPGHEFGPEIEEEEVVEFANGVTVPLSTWATRRSFLPDEFDPRWYGIGVPEWADEARAAAKGRGPAQATGQASFVPPAVKPIAEKTLERAEDAMGAALDRLLRSVRLDEDSRLVPPKVAAIVPLPVAEDPGEAPEKPAEEVQP